MPINYISTNQTTTQSVVSNDDVILLEGVSVYTVDDAIEANFAGANNGITVTIQGALYGATGIDLWEQSSENNDVWIYIGSEGHVHGTEDAIAVRQGDDNILINYGEITAQQAGVYFQGGEATIYNHGSISSFGNGGQGAIIFNATADGTDVREVVNTGVIEGAPQSTGSSVYSAIQNSSGAEFHLDNSGSVLAIGARAVYSSATETFINNSGTIFGEIVTSGTTEFNNSGTISGDLVLSGSTELSNTGSINGDITANNVTTFVNDGTITGDLNSSNMTMMSNLGTFSGSIISANVVLLANTGIIDGPFLLGTGENRVENSGTILSDVTLGDGADVYRGDGDSLVSGDVLGGFGDDRLLGGDNEDVIKGEDDADFLAGRGGNDELFGGIGEDTVRGNSGDDFIKGGADNDFVYGGLGDDEIFGGSGDDTITGGKGEDLLTGNSGADVFVFARRSGDDEITDFENNVDRLDLSTFSVTGRSDLTSAGAIIDNGLGTIIDLTKIGGDGVIVVDDMNVGDWSNADFIF